MPTPRELILGEFPRTLDDRYRMTIPPELVDTLGAVGKCILAKEQTGCLSLWNTSQWKSKLDEGVALVRGKMQAGRLDGRIEEVQLLGRLLSTRHREVPLGARGRITIPEGFREFLAVEPAGELMLVGAGVCVEIWQPAAWLSYVQGHMPEFRQLFDRLSG